MRSWWVILTVAGMVGACAQGHCRRPAELPTAAPLPPETEIGPTSEEDHVYVFKYDGSLQCNMGRAIAPEVMVRELRGVTVYSSSRKNDGLVHIEACGSPTGQANLFEVSSKDLKKAEKLGFKRWTAD